MIVVRIELHSAITHRVTILGQMIIANRGDSSDPKKGNYDVAIANKNHACSTAISVFRNKGFQSRQGEVLNYPRLSYNVWRLVCRALKSAFPEEKNG